LEVAEALRNLAKNLVEAESSTIDATDITSSRASRC
jgi:hypothetical protein